MLLFVLITGSIGAPTVHSLLHESRNQHVVWERHSVSDQVNFDVECDRAHAPERPCILCTQLTVHVGVLANSIPGCIETSDLALPEYSRNARFGPSLWAIRGPPEQA